MVEKRGEEMERNKGLAIKKDRRQRKVIGKDGTCLDGDIR